MNTIVNVIAKAVILLIILFCIFFIIYPHACNNIATGKIEPDVIIQDPLAQGPLTPAAIKNEQALKAETAASTETKKVEGVVDTNTIQDASKKVEPAAPVAPADKSMAGIFLDDNPFAKINTTAMTQDEFDYLVIERYVTLEDRYLAKHPNDKDASTVIAKQVMADAGITETDWQEILTKATEKGWFERARSALKAAKTAAQTVK